MKGLDSGAALCNKGTTRATHGVGRVLEALEKTIWALQAAEKLYREGTKRQGTTRGTHAVGRVPQMSLKEVGASAPEGCFRSYVRVAGDSPRAQNSAYGGTGLVGKS